MRPWKFWKWRSSCSRGPASPRWRGLPLPHPPLLSKRYQWVNGGSNICPALPVLTSRRNFSSSGCRARVAASM